MGTIIIDGNVISNSNIGNSFIGNSNIGGNQISIDCGWKNSYKSKS